jgi:hypothetical protein
VRFGVHVEAGEISLDADELRTLATEVGAA